MTLFGVEINSFGYKTETNKQSYSATEGATGRTFIIENNDIGTKHATLQFWETLPDLSAYTDSDEATFQEGIDAVKAGLTA